MQIGKIEQLTEQPSIDRQIELLKSPIPKPTKEITDLGVAGVAIANTIIEEKEKEIEQLRKALEPFAQLSSLGKEDSLPDETTLEVHLSNKDHISDIVFFRHQKPYKPFTLGHIRRARELLGI